MTIARKRIERLTLVTVVLAFVLEGMGCDGDPIGGSILNKVVVTVTKTGAGTGRVISSDIITPEEETVINLDCGPSVTECSIEFQDAGGGGTLTLTATPDPGSVFSEWVGMCTPMDPECTVTPANGTADLDFPSSDSVLFSVTAIFDLLPPVCSGQARFEFTDDAFVDAEWTSFKHFDTTPQASFQAGQRTDEGNPAPSRSTKHDYCGPGGIIVAHWNTAETFDPGSQPANFVTIAFDARKFPWVAGSGADVVIRILVKQGASYYEGGGIEVQALDFAWLNNNRACMTSAGMTKSAGPGPMNPDFSQPMQFGYATANSSPTTACVTGRESLVDNFLVEVR